jgi:tetratricopeptide (TPR) repeat protein
VVQGDALLALGREDEALLAYRRAVASDRKNDRAHEMVEAIAARKLDAEEIALVEGSRSRPDAAAWLALTRRRIGEERFDAAVRSARAALAAGAGDEGLFLLALALEGRGRSAESVEAFDALLARHGPSGPLLAESGFALFDDGRPEEARRRFEAALALDARSAPALYGLALLDKFAGRPDLALERCREVVALEPPGSPWARSALGQLRELER